MATTPEFIASVSSDMDADISPEDIRSAVSSGNAVIDEFPEGFAVINPEGYHSTEPGAHLWLLWLRPECRKRGLGVRLVRRLVDKYAVTYQMSLICSGGNRAKFFGRCGFKVEKREVDDYRMMITYR